MAEKNFVQREKRFEVGDLSNFEAVVCRGESDDSIYFAELMDFSRSGLKFRVPFSARFDEKLSIRLSCKNSEVEFEGVGRVRHIRNTDVNRWIVGCSIDPTLTEEVISFLASATQQERRKNVRLDVNAIGTLSRQGAIDETSAQIKNVSTGGFCLFVGESHESGSRVNFTIDNRIGYTEKIKARVRWQRKLDQGYLLGLSYADNESHDKLVDCLDLPLVRRDSMISSMSWKMVACALFAMLLPSLSFLLLGASFDSNKKGASMTPTTSTVKAQRITNPFAIKEQNAAQPKQDGPEFEKSNPELASTKSSKKPGQPNQAAHDATPFGQPPKSLTNSNRIKPRRLRVQQDSQENVAGENDVASDKHENVVKFDLSSGKNQDEATTRRGGSTRKLLIPSETIRKRLLH